MVDLAAPPPVEDGVVPRKVFCFFKASVELNGGLDRLVPQQLANGFVFSRMLGQEDVAGQVPEQVHIYNQPSLVGDKRSNLRAQLRWFLLLAVA